MIEELISNIDIKAIITTLNNLEIKIPKTTTGHGFFENLKSPRVSIVQLTYTGDSYVISRYYISFSYNVELTLNEEFGFHVLNICYEEDDCSISSFNIEGEQIANYYINRDALSGYNNSTYMRKSTGDIYVPSFRPLSGEYESIRREWDKTERLLCYSEKKDGRMCFYITVDQEFHWKIKEDLFMSKVK